MSATNTSVDVETELKKIGTGADYDVQVKKGNRLVCMAHESFENGTSVITRHAYMDMKHDVTLVIKKCIEKPEYYEFINPWFTVTVIDAHGGCLCMFKNRHLEWCTREDFHYIEDKNTLSKLRPYFCLLRCVNRKLQWFDATRKQYNANIYRVLKNECNQAILPENGLLRIIADYARYKHC